MDIDVLLRMIENPLRRKILYKLTKEAHYPLQLSKELKVSQQAVLKHLKALEEAGMVRSFEKEGKRGPRRTYYVPTGRFMIQIDVGPSIFDIDMKTVEELEESGVVFEDLEAEYNRILKKKNPIERLKELSRLLKDIDERIDEIEKKKASLCMLKQRVSEEANRIIRKVEDYRQRNILYQLVEKDYISVRKLAREVDMREEIVEEILRDLYEEGIFA
ncbi:MAG: ArsR/SmtB family transcription factor [Candidatus Syntropharchaeia archaeon]